MIPLLLFITCSCQQAGREVTRGIGIYPGNPEEDFSPKLKSDSHAYRNLARFRPAWHSSSYDYNLTAQLVTDGIITSEMPATLLLETQKGMVPKNEKEWVLDHVTGSGISLDGSEVWLKLGWEGGAILPEVTRIVLHGNVVYDEDEQEGYRFMVSGSMDGLQWEELDRSSGTGLPGFTRANPFARRQRSEGDTTRPRFDFFADFMGPRDPGEPQPSFTFSFGERPPRRNLEETFVLKNTGAWRYYRIKIRVPGGITEFRSRPQQG
jgi:hypothetical protein